MTKEEHIEYWVVTAEHDWDVAISLFESARYDWCLYLGHLVIEKLLKAHYVKTNDVVPPKIHDLRRLAEKVELDFTAEQLSFFEHTNNFNIEARYPNEKLTFYKMCTKEFTEEKFKLIEEMYKWLRSRIV
jgi:HEPN domain-containing protein